jgi:hypothetical protein
VHAERVFVQIGIRPAAQNPRRGRFDRIRVLKLRHEGLGGHFLRGDTQSDLYIYNNPQKERVPTQNHSQFSIFKKQAQQNYDQHATLGRALLSQAHHAKHHRLFLMSSFLSQSIISILL